MAPSSTDYWGRPGVVGRILEVLAFIAVRLAECESRWGHRVDAWIRAGRTKKAPAPGMVLRTRSSGSRAVVHLVIAIMAAAGFGCRDSDTPMASEPWTPSLATAATSQALSFRQVSAGTAHSCGVTTDDRAYCWGVNWGGQLGNGTQRSSLAPVPVTGGLRFQDIRAGDGHTCAITTDERAYCWGFNSGGQLGDGTTFLRTAPVPVGGGRRFRQISAGSHHTCAVTPTDVAFCWGFAEYGRLGTGTPEYAVVTTPTRVAGGLRFRQVIAAWSHTCGATTDFRAYCWGLNLTGQLGDGTKIMRLKPVAVAGGLPFRQVVPASGLILGSGPAVPENGAVTCGVTTDDRGYCWGRGPLTPAEIPGNRRYRFVSPGDLHQCAITTANEPFCWGFNDYGTLGTGQSYGVPNYTATPVKVAGGLALLNLSASAVGEHNCAVTTDHRAYCWGINSSGQLGDGTATPRPTPVAVLAPM